MRGEWNLAFGFPYHLPSFIYSFKYYSFCLSPAAPLIAFKPLSSGVCSIRRPAEWANPRGVFHSRGMGPWDPQSAGRPPEDHHLPEEMRGWVRDYRGRAERRPGRGTCVRAGGGLGWWRSYLRNDQIEGPWERGGGRERLGSEDLLTVSKTLLYSLSSDLSLS